MEIEYNGITYPTFEVETEDGFRYVAHERLENALMPNGAYADDIARNIDEAIYFYIPDDITNSTDAQRYVDLNCF